MNHLLVVDDDIRMAKLLKEFLSNNGYYVSIVQNTMEAKEVLSLFKIELIILDYMIPGESGIQFLQNLRNSSSVAVIMLTALGEQKYILEGLETGADDYLSKPFDPQELLLRVRNTLRRTSVAKKTDILFFGSKKFELTTGNLFDEYNNLIKLTSGEKKLLSILASKEQSIVSRDELLQGQDVHFNERTIDVQIKRLRDKIESGNDSPRFLQTIRGKGYCLYFD
jgi:two-component system phosphate regulon response regulator OmpR